MKFHKISNCPWIMYGTAWKKGETQRLVELAYSFGFLAFDTANQPKHYAEPFLGDAIRALAARGVKREQLFLQTKFTPLDGQDHRVPYDRNADCATQVRQSLVSSLENLATKYLDSYLLHGPYVYPGLSRDDWEVWSTLEELYEAGKVRAIGISNVNAEQLTTLIQKAKIPPMVVQNRCYASRGWDRTVRNICRQHLIMYQGFSLLTANHSVLNHPFILSRAQQLAVSPEQVVYCFSSRIGMLPLSGTTNEMHMRQALEAVDIPLTETDLSTIEKLEG